MIDIVHQHILPAAFSILPPRMASPQATAMLLAIGLQESGFNHRAQLHGPARGFWQFERSGANGVRHHRASSDSLLVAMESLGYTVKLQSVGLMRAIEHNDILAAAMARLLLWTLPGALPARHEADIAWLQYLDAWRPGKPHRATWDAHYVTAWDMVIKT